MQFSICCLSIFLHSQTKKSFAIPTIKIRKEIFKFEKFYFSKWLTPQVKTFMLRKGTVQISLNALIILPKDWSSFRSLISTSKSAYFKRYPRPQHFAGHKCDKRGSMFNHHHHENGSTIDVFLNFFSAKINHRTDLKWEALC